eukprot:11250150-Prorocentrum_lima.AAC.1
MAGGSRGCAQAAGIKRIMCQRAQGLHLQWLRGHQKLENTGGMALFTAAQLDADGLARVGAGTHEM